MGSLVSHILPPDTRIVENIKSNLLSWVKPHSVRFVPTEEEVCVVQEIFLPHLPIELANAILDEAEYWPRLYCQKESDPPRQIAASQPPDSATCCYFISPRIPEHCNSGRNKFTVRRVVFHTLSHDQGWDVIPGLLGQYSGSSTWFEAAICRGLDEHDDKEPDVTALMMQESSINGPFQVPNPYDNGSNVWLLQKNVRASRDEVMHEIVWDLKDSTSALPDNPDRFLDVTGAGLGQGFVRELRSGDSIAIIARAQGLNWVNYVAGVDVQIFYSL